MVLPRKKCPQCGYERVPRIEKAKKMSALRI